jgi:hypothetical protein
VQGVLLWALVAVRSRSSMTAIDSIAQTARRLSRKRAAHEPRGQTSDRERYYS